MAGASRLRQKAVRPAYIQTFVEFRLFGDVNVKHLWFRRGRIQQIIVHVNRARELFYNLLVHKRYRRIGGLPEIRPFALKLQVALIRTIVCISRPIATRPRASAVTSTWRG